MIVFYLLTFLVEILGTVGGFGSSVFFVPMASRYFEFHNVLGIVSLLHIFSNLSKIVLFRQGIDKDIFIKIGIPSVIFVIIGAYLSQFIDTKLASISLGIFMILFAGFLILKPNFILRPNLKNSILGGGLSGFLAGAIGTGGAVRGLTLASFNISKNTFLATSALIDFLVDSSRFVMYVKQGYLSSKMLSYAIPLLVVSIVGSYIGKLLLNKISQETFKKITLYMILLVGIIGLFFTP